MGILERIPVQSTSGFIGLGLLILGGFMILAGFDIISIEKITVNQGRRTWVVGIIFAAVGLVMLFPEFTSSPEVARMDIASGSVPTDAASSALDLSETPNEWIPVEFLVSNSSLWRDTAEGVYTAIGSEDAFAWSTRTYDGNLMVSLDLKSPESQASGCIIVYGNGQGFSYGSLIFCVDWDGYGLEKHTIYHQGENYLTFVHSDVDLKDRAYSVTIKIKDDLATMYVNGKNVLSSVFDPEEIDRAGRIGLLKKWWDPEITFSNIQARKPSSEG